VRLIYAGQPASHEEMGWPPRMAAERGVSVISDYLAPADLPPRASSAFFELDASWVQSTEFVLALARYYTYNRSAFSMGHRARVRDMQQRRPSPLHPAVGPASRDEGFALARLPTSHRRVSFATAIRRRTDSGLASSRCDLVMESCGSAP